MSRAMKDSGIPWIGEIPKEWNCSKTKFFTRISSGDGISNEELQDGGEYEVLGGGSGIMGYHNNYNIDGDNLIIGRVGACGYVKRTNGKRYVSDNALIMRITSNTLLFNYLYYVLTSAELSRLNTSTAQPLITATKVYNVSIPLPSLAEQQRIAEFLDRKCGEVDEMIALQEQIIEELKAYKQSVITEAVTKGLNPDVPMKDSGIEWIGNIPEHWEVTKFYRICSVITDFVASGSFESLRINVPYLDYPDYAMLVRTVDLSGKGRAAEKVYISKHSYDFLNNSNLFGGEIILPNIGASVGDVYIVPNLYERMSLAPNSIMFKTKQCDKYWYYYFYSEAGKQSIFDICQSTAQPKFNKTELRDIRVCIPTNDEQQAIADYLDEKCADIDSLIQTKQSKIDSLKEYKKSIIYEYVTGKREI